jgi:hypothetical protein
MTNRFLISVAALALIAGTGLANAQGTGGREQGGAQIQSAPSSAGGGTATEHENSKAASPSSGMKSEKSPAVGQGQRGEENVPAQKSKSMSSENQKGPPDNMKAEGREGRNADKAAETKQPSRETSTTVGQAGAAAKLSTEQRTRITTIIRDAHVAPVNNVDFAISVGTRVPRERISLRVLPTEVVTVYPQWRGYEFFLVGDKIVVVDPRTLEIVDVLEA